MIPGLSFVKHSFFVCPSFAREISVDYLSFENVKTEPEQKSTDNFNCFERN